jgi:transcription antitermination factor NusG
MIELSEGAVRHNSPQHPTAARVVGPTIALKAETLIGDRSAREVAMAEIPQVGERAVIVESAFEGVDGRVSDVDLSRQRCVLLCDLWGRDTPIDLPISDVRSASD